ncbi:hypothetical protein GW17_00019189, partial [Ensete ventricosum]
PATALLLLSTTAILSYRFQPAFTAAFLSSLLLSPAPTAATAPNTEAPAASSHRLSLSSPWPPVATFLLHHRQPSLLSPVTPHQLAVAAALSLSRLFLHRPPLFFSSQLPSPLLINRRLPNPCYCRHRPALCRSPRRTLLPCRCQPLASLLSTPSSPCKPLPSLLPPIAPSHTLLCRTSRCCLPPVPPCDYRRLALGNAQPAVARPSSLPPLPQRCRAQQRCCYCLPAMFSRCRSPRRTAAALFLPPIPAATFTAPFALLTLLACRSSAIVAAPSSAA